MIILLKNILLIYFVSSLYLISKKLALVFFKDNKIENILILYMSNKYSKKRKTRNIKKRKTYYKRKLKYTKKKRGGFRPGLKLCLTKKNVALTKGPE